MTDLEVEFDVTSGFVALEAPDKLPTIFNGDKAVIYGIFKSKAASDMPLEAGVSGNATLKGKVLGVPFEHTIPFQIPPPSDSPDPNSFQMPIVHHLAAKSLIHDWEHKEGWASTASESERKQEIIRVSIESSVVSAHTAYIAVDEEQDKPIEGAIQTWDLTATLAASEGGWGYGGGGLKKVKKSRGGGGGMLFGGPPPPARMACMKRSAGPPPPPGAGGLSIQSEVAAGPPRRAREEVLCRRKASPARPLQSDGLFEDKSLADPVPSAPPPRNMQMMASSAPTSSVSAGELTQLISLQQAEGFWNLDKVSEFVKKAISSPIPGVSDTIWATIVALVLLESRFSQQQDEWELIAMKAETWLSMQSLPAGVDIMKLKPEAKKLV